MAQAPVASAGALDAPEGTPARIPALRVIEFYSGIGGARLGMEQWAAAAGRRVETVAAYDMNAQANAVYALNFKMQPRNRAIEHVKPPELNKLKADVWLMSPPCQPFTPGGGRGGKRGDEDTRCASFTHLVKLLAEGAATRPDYLLLENVVNFGESQACAQLADTLRAAGYSVRSVTASPDILRDHATLTPDTLPSGGADDTPTTPDTGVSDGGIPYNRPRFYLLAARSALKDLEGDVTEQQLRHDLHVRDVEGVVSPPVTLSAFLESRGVGMSGHDADGALRVGVDALGAHPTYRFDCVVRSEAGHVASCITKSYGQSHRGSGSLVVVPGAEEEEVDQPAKRPRVGEAVAPARSLRVAGGELPSHPALRGGGAVRHLSPEEALALHGFPRAFSFPPGVGNVGKWRLIGNSLSCDVHRVLCRLLF